MIELNIWYKCSRNIFLMNTIMESSSELGDDTLQNSLLQWMVGYHSKVCDFHFDAIASRSDALFRI